MNTTMNTMREIKTDELKQAAGGAAFIRFEGIKGESAAVHAGYDLKAAKKV